MSDQRMKRTSLMLLLTCACLLAAFGCPFSHVFAATPQCARCHPKEAARFAATPMGQSLVAPAPLPSGTITHQASHSVLTIRRSESCMIHGLSEAGFSAEYRVRYQVGGGLMGASFLVEIGDYLFESPASWFRRYDWDVSPGYASAHLIDFDRPIDQTCLFCHGELPRAADADGRRFPGSALQPISCERCHGSGNAHSLHPSSRNIVNPAKLTGASRDSICEQCHLEAGARVLNPGKSWTDFHPGEPAEQTFATYLLNTSSNGEVVAVNHVEQLAQSLCVRMSGGKLWCGTCHDPHGPTADRQSQIWAICTSCHTSFPPPTHASGQKGCATCHMPQSPTTNIAHAALTDHRILRRPSEARPETEQSEVVSAWREPPEEDRERDSGLAEILIGTSKNLPALTQEGTRLLDSLPISRQHDDPEVLSALEGLALQRGDYQKAMECGRRVIEMRPQSALAAMNLGLVLLRSGNTAEAERQLTRATELNPLLKPAYGELLELYARQHETEKMTQTIERFLNLNSQDILFRIEKNRLDSGR